MGANADHPLQPRAVAYLEARQAFTLELKAYRDLAGTIPVAAGATSMLADILTTIAGIRANQTALQTWTSWCDIRKKAIAHGLQPFVSALEQKSLEPDEAGPAFELAYARWWLPGAIDADPIIRQFKRFQHEDALADFKRLDELAQAGAHHPRSSEKLARKSARPERGAATDRNSDCCAIRWNCKGRANPFAT